ncbi:MAG: peptidylprolyl isomerase [Pseudomonadota bacterium]|nr:peptidylprolyl isomerase [Pseudomonadota bacterium]
MNSLTTLVLVLNIGTVKIELLPEVAPLHVAQIQKLVENKSYDGIVFHRVIDGFMAQTGDVSNGHYQTLNKQLVGTGGSTLPNIPAEFNAVSHQKGTVSMARSASPDSANSQFFICFGDASFLDGQYSAFGRVIEGMDIVDNIAKGHPQSGAVDEPDYIESAHLE